MSAEIILYHTDLFGVWKLVCQSLKKTGHTRVWFAACGLEQRADRSTAQWQPVAHRNQIFHRHNAPYVPDRSARPTVPLHLQSENKGVRQNRRPDNPDHKAAHTMPKWFPYAPESDYPAFPDTRCVLDAVGVRLFENLAHFCTRDLLDIPQFNRFVR